MTVDPPLDVEVELRASTVRKRRPRGLDVAAEAVLERGAAPRLRLRVAGEVRRGQTVRRTVWVRHRALYTAALLRRALRDAGVEVTGAPRVATLRDYLGRCLDARHLPVPLAEHRSPSLAAIVARINKHSVNWLADRVIMTAAARQAGGRPTMEKAVAAMHAWLERRAGIPANQVVIDTGSGLSYRTQLTARQLVRVLLAARSRAGDDATGRAFTDSLAVGGSDGTLRHRFRGLRARVRGKTGSLRQVVATTGVVQVGERELAFSIVTNGHRHARRGRVRRGHDAVVEILADRLADRD